MKKADLDKWCDALKSGDYKQITHYLHNNKGYCCVGIYGVVVMGFKPEDIDTTDEKSDNCREVYKQFEDIVGSAEAYNYYYLNDKGTSFDQIAEYARENIKVGE